MGLAASVSSACTNVSIVLLSGSARVRGWSRLADGARGERALFARRITGWGVARVLTQASTQQSSWFNGGGG